MSEITSMFRNTLIARGTEATDRLTNVYLPSIGCPPEMAAEFVKQLQTQDAKNFRRWLSEWIKSVFVLPLVSISRSGGLPIPLFCFCRSARDAQAQAAKAAAAQE